MDFPIAATVSATSALLSAVAAGASWRAARKSNDTAAAVAAIEHNRWHTELTPTFDIAFTDQGNDRAMLRLTLTGPAGLDRLDQLTVSVRGDGFNHDPVGGYRSEAEAAEYARTIWGPYRFVYGSDGGSEDGKRVDPVCLELGDWALFSMSRTLAPSWYGDHSMWRQEHSGKPVRLTMTGMREGSSLG
ncbi:hypothetical protein [Streptacidiphilus sp. EB129]|uniref:hypothetical protein n=1 Tax=Streptacidiphilus sp. EB129 TaxID=3156262 RepID=UPI003518ED27